MKRSLILLLTAGFFGFQTLAQDLSYGAKVSMGSGFLKSASLQDHFAERNRASESIKEFDIKNQFAFTYSLGGFISYSLQPNLTILAELSYQRLQANATIEFMEDDAISGLSSRESITSKNKFSMNSVNIPLIARYHVNQQFFAQMGFAFDFLLSNDLQAEETIIEQEFDSGNVVATEKTLLNNTAEVDGYTSTRSSFLLGGGTTLKVSGSDLTLDFRYHIPITKSQIYTSDLALRTTRRTARSLRFQSS